MRPNINLRETRLRRYANLFVLGCLPCRFQRNRHTQVDFSENDEPVKRLQYAGVSRAIVVFVPQPCGV